MGYNISITRAPESFADGKIDIDEWIEYVESDPEMRLDGVAEANMGNSTLIYENEGLAVWIEWSKNEIDGAMAWFDHSNDTIAVKNPDKEILAKMLQIAKALSADVIGEEGEFYTEDSLDTFQ